MFTAATMTDNNVRDAIVSQLWGYASRNLSQNIFPSTFKLNGLGTSSTGNSPRCVQSFLSPVTGVNHEISPAVGGVFAPLALR